MIIKGIKYDKNLITLDFKDENMSLIIQSNKPFPREYAEDNIRILQKLLKEGKFITLKKFYFSYLKDINKYNDLTFGDFDNLIRIYLKGLRDGGYVIKNIVYSALLLMDRYDDCVLTNFMFESTSKLINLKLIVKER